MPLINIETNQALKDEAILKELSQTVATILGKPESYVMLKYRHNENMLFAGNSEPLAHIQLKSLGLPEDQTGAFSTALCNAIEKHFSVSPERIYIEFSSPERHMWGWNSSTF